MKKGKIFLAAATAVVAFVGAFSLNARSAKFNQATLFTANLKHTVNCARVLIGSNCPVTAYTAGGKVAVNPKAVAQ